MMDYSSSTTPLQKASAWAIYTILSSYVSSAFTVNTHASSLLKTPHRREMMICNIKIDASKIPEEDIIEDEWDGVPIEGVHNEEFVADDEDEAFVPSISFMSMANSIPSAVLENVSGFDANTSDGDNLHHKSENECDLNKDDLLDMGGDPFFFEEEWDGIPIEGAHDEEFEPGSGKIDAADAFVPSASFMSMVNSVPIISAGNVFDPLRNMGKLHRDELAADGDVSQDGLLEMGGDPFFLENDGMGGNVSTMIKGLDEPDDIEWDGTVDEDAHMDYD